MKSRDLEIGDVWCSLPGVRSLRMVCVVVAIELLGASCARVKPYQRETHAQRAMQDPDPVEQKLDDHVNEYREGAIGGTGVGGGGCGCN